MDRKNIVVALVALALCVLPTMVQAQMSPAVGNSAVSADTLMKHVRTLSSAQMAGRLAGTEAYGRAVEYVKRVLASYGVEDMGDEEFTVECNEVENCTFEVYTPGSKEKQTYTLGNDFCCAGMTGRGYVDAQMVFCGYGVDHSLMNEYKDVDVRGKVVVVLTGMPQRSALTKSAAAHYQTLRDKARTAERHGAIGLIAVNISPLCAPDEPQSRVYCGELPHMPTFPLLQLTLNCGREVFADEAHPLDSLMGNPETAWTPRSFSLQKKAAIDVNARYRPTAPTANVVGILKGSDRKLEKEYVVVGASLDGAGMQGATCFFPGADINASGVAALLETARLLKNPKVRPARSIVFVVFSGSEQQYLGSRIFVNNFGKLRRVEAFVNVQNVGYGDSLMVLGGNRYPTLSDIALQCDLSKGGPNMVRHTAERTDPRGDARAFDAVGIPSIVITSHNGMHHNHVCSDIWETIDRRMLTAATQLLTGTVAKLGEGLYQGRSVQSRAGRH